ncbi:sigma-70 family RNA polymerase sigma factor [cf. Phormidesmis sp. LEGE 11477]|uniref:sigma-70 family RNA polymerase sigma factor n=1 Tax=cf. Phormidesmis sp. LEGE 11477 TaxID=1828680 RepID=UPI001D136B42|nr:sigma-70 family RNA polymerase sigma factor [cf. Phormidesmis sp. LEGE 11477]
MGKVSAPKTVLQSMSRSSDRLEPLLELVQQTCQHPTGSRQRQRGLTKLIQALTNQLWHTYDTYYPDALQQTWIYFCRNLCEATTARAYDPTQARLTTWLNAYLKRRLQDFQIDENYRRVNIQSQSSSVVRREDGTVLDPIDRLPAPADIPPLLEQVRAWAETDADDTLKSICINQHPNVTAQLLILRRLPPETPWKQLSKDCGLSIGTLSSFYNRKCFPLLREFGKSQGYL